jgi:plasmid stabilization system protein ParE
VIRVIFSKKADKEANIEFVKYCSVSPELAVRFREELDSKVGALSENPFLCHNRGGGIFSVRLKVFPFSLYYRIKTDHIRVLAFLHYRRSPQRYKRRK